MGSAYSTLAELQETVTDPEIGDMYNVGESAPYTIYRWTGTEWESQGKLEGPQGPQGEKGDSGVYLGSDMPTNPDDSIWIDPNGPSDSLPVASATQLGGVMIGDGLEIDANGVLSLSVTNASGVSF